MHTSLGDDTVIINGVKFELQDTLSKTYHETEKKEVVNLSENVNNGDTKEINYRPIVGILAQELSSSLEPWYGENYTSYIGAAYVKYLESAGARVVPVLINQVCIFLLNISAAFCLYLM